jgi:hypothetical protein
MKNTDRKPTPNTYMYLLTRLIVCFSFSFSFSGGRCRSTLREPQTVGKQLVNIITCDFESSAPFSNLQIWARTQAVLVIGLYELLGNPTA